ncbi:sperm acrosome membrane-associated protein 1 [Acipenser oxyrinchus oxyrinchus]|uniref:Sperm acrosome membrane-associated protein 1 n=1 Tax=Acipenser oxyrinchus oxyrinchus TaxID=40147 RepID=A0AAD8LRP3_ACIOX|nr:sperm acrosome membrane-associated protein 1 [Acipenser oxyrinchus oxyrinchus]
MSDISYLEEVPCSVTCGIGHQEILKTKGCPGNKKTCVLRTAECRGAVDCGVSPTIPLGPTRALLYCVAIVPFQRFTFVWTVTRNNVNPFQLPDNTISLEVIRRKSPVEYRCDTFEKGDVISTIRFIVDATGEEEDAEAAMLLNKGESGLLFVALGLLLILASFFIISTLLFLYFKR